MLSDKTPYDKKVVVVTVPGIHATYSVRPENLEPKLIHSWVQARQRNRRKVKAIPQQARDTTPASPDQMIDSRQGKAQQKLPPIVTLYTPSSPPSQLQPRKTLYSNYMDNLISPGQNHNRSRLKWEGHYRNKTQDPAIENPLSYDFINFVGSPILSRDKYLQSLQTGKSAKPLPISKESSLVSSHESTGHGQNQMGLPSKRLSPNSWSTDDTKHENEAQSEPQLLDSMTLPCIEEILRAEGIEEVDIAQQLRIIKDDELKTFIKSHDLPPPPEEEHRLPRLTKVSVNVMSEPDHDRQVEIETKRELNPFLNGQIREWLQSFKHKQHLAMLRQSRVPEMPIVISKSKETNVSNVPVTNINVPNHFWPRVVLVANNVPKSDLLVNTVLHRRNDLITIHYAFDSHSLSSLLRDIQKRLQSYHEKWNTTSMKSLLVVCNGGPGYFHLVKGKPITAQVLQKDESIDVSVFLKGISTLFSSSGSFHMMGCDAFSGKLGKQFLSLLEKKLSHASVTVEQLDHRPGRQQTLRLYMDPKQYRRWMERLAKLHTQ